MAGAASVANAGIVHVTGPFNVFSSPIDIVQGDEDDRILNHILASTSSGGYVSATPGAGNGQLRLWNTGTLIVRSGARSVGPAVGFPTFTNRIAFQNSANNPGSLVNGAVQGTDNFVGFRITDPDVNSGNPVYGWFRLDLPTSGPTAVSSEVFDFAYEDSGNPILVGQTVVPEPSSLALLAMGAAGLCAFRSRKTKR